MKKRELIKSLLQYHQPMTEITIMGWVRAFRNNQFVIVNDGSTVHNVQCVIDFKNIADEELKRFTLGTAVSMTGEWIESKGAGQEYELKVTSFEIFGDCDSELYPIQPRNKPSLEFMREKAHLRVRTPEFASIMRIRSVLSNLIHSYFYFGGFHHVHTPIITGSDAEGAGEMFQVDSSEGGFFGRTTNLTVSGQLEAETYAMGLGQVYTFGPTFRAENSNTSRHLAEFWMVEPEVAFNDLEDNMELAENFIKFTLMRLLNVCRDDIELLEKRLIEEDKKKPAAERNEMKLIEKLQFVKNNAFVRVSYTEAIEILKNSKPYKSKKFKFPVEWGIDLQSEHERYLVEKHFKKPVIVYDYPKEIKSFYMRLNDDGKTVAAMDILFPQIGEIIGGSQREERLSVLTERMEELGVSTEQLWWYLDTRRFGSAPHSGFGLGFERLVMFVTGMSNIKDVIPFPRTPMNAEF